jgi:hypothetical protein
MRYRVHGVLTRELRFTIDEEVEADSEEEAIDLVCDDLSDIDADNAEDDTFNMKVEEVEEESDVAEDRRLRAMGVPMLPGLY